MFNPLFHFVPVEWEKPSIVNSSMIQLDLLSDAQPFNNLLSRREMYVLHDATKEGDVDEVCELLAAASDINSTDRVYQLTPLQSAAQYSTDISR